MIYDIMIYYSQECQTMDYRKTIATALRTHADVNEALRSAVDAYAAERPLNALVDELSNNLDQLSLMLDYTAFTDEKKGKLQLWLAGHPGYLRQLREGMTQKEVANAAGTQQVRVSYLENGSFNGTSLGVTIRMLNVYRKLEDERAASSAVRKSSQANSAKDEQRS